MKTTKLLIVLALCLVAGISAGYGQNLPAKVKISNIKNQKGIIYFGFYSKGNDFPTDGKQAYEFSATPNGNDALTILVPSVPAGDYAIAVYQDVNQNHKLDKNLFGMPKEPFGFSQNFHPKLSKPKFEDCKISIQQRGETISISLIN